MEDANQRSCSKNQTKPSNSVVVVDDSGIKAEATTDKSRNRTWGPRGPEMGFWEVGEAKRVKVAWTDQVREAQESVKRKFAGSVVIIAAAQVKP